jgi:DMSO/TMAO reductase YedYZ heme-binding membrane subunit
VIRRLALGVAIGLGLLLVVDALAVRLGIAPGVLPTVAGTTPWILSRAAGVTAYLALALDVIAGLALSTGAFDRVVPRARSLELHRSLSVVALALTGLHTGALLVDRFIRFDVLAVLVPFASSYRAPAVALGVAAAYAALVVHLSFGWRKRLGPKTWRRLHYTSFAAFAAALLHGLLAGSDTGATGMRLLYAATAIAIVALVAIRLTASRVRAARRPARGAAGRS